MGPPSSGQVLLRQGWCSPSSASSLLAFVLVFLPPSVTVCCLLTKIPQDPGRGRLRWVLGARPCQEPVGAWEGLPWCSRPWSALKPRHLIWEGGYWRTPQCSCGPSIACVILVAALESRHAHTPGLGFVMDVAAWHVRDAEPRCGCPWQDSLWEMVLVLASDFWVLSPSSPPHQWAPPRGGGCAGQSLALCRDYFSFPQDSSSWVGAHPLVSSTGRGLGTWSQEGLKPKEEV